MEHIDIGDSVIPLTKAGLWLGDAPVNGEYQQKRNSVCVFNGIGKVIDTNTCIIDYDEWDRLNASLRDGEDHVPYNIGKLVYTDYLIQCSDGIGWGSGITKVQNDSLTTDESDQQVGG